jgi:uncharacterized protein YeaC (DUF1315 family)
VDYQEQVKKLDPALVKRLRRAVEIGRWPDGQLLTSPQREHSLRAIIAWEAAHLTEDQRVGFIDKGKKAQGEVCDSPEPLRWLDDSMGASEK